MDVSIILATYKRHIILQKTLQSFSLMNTNNIQWELIIIDNAEDKYTNYVVNCFKENLPIKFFIETKVGKNNALNKGIKQSNGEIFIFTDDDIIATKTWLEETISGVQRWPNYSLFGGRILPKFPKSNMILNQTHPFFKSAFVCADWSIKEGPYEAAKVWGPNMIVRSNVFRNGYKFDTKIGPQRTNYISGSETEFVLRLEKDGYKAVYLPNSLVYHQIRSEQLKARWLYGRAFRAGRMNAYLNLGQFSNLPATLGIHFSLVRKIIKIGIKRSIYFLDRDKYLDFGIKFWKLIGQVYGMLKKS